jgi:hypothetical protein
MYGRVAVAAARALAENPELSLGTAWNEAAARETQSIHSLRKGAPPIDLLYAVLCGLGARCDLRSQVRHSR